MGDWTQAGIDPVSAPRPEGRPVAAGGGLTAEERGDLGAWISTFRQQECEHYSEAPNTSPLCCSPCLRDRLLIGPLAAHVEAAVLAERERIAAAIEAEAEQLTRPGSRWPGGYLSGLHDAARIARSAPEVDQ